MKKPQLDDLYEANMDSNISMSSTVDYADLKVLLKELVTMEFESAVDALAEFEELEVE